MWCVITRNKQKPEDKYDIFLREVSFCLLSPNIQTGSGAPQTLIHCVPENFLWGKLPMLGTLELYLYSPYVLA